ncbi:MAG TPA: acyl-CoA dehydrogenase family protein [Blastocatellia bacterium]|nr:acyl-CoA dehydrogenase family protein [Blastocatellia bacterium]
MTSIAEGKRVIQGGSFILEDHDPHEVFTPDDLSDEHLMIAQTAREFTENEVMTNDEQIEKKDYELTRQLLRKAGELGLLSIDIPEEYGGAGLDLLSSLVASENMTGQASFSGSLGAHTTIGTLPIVYFGNEEQKKKYLPRLATGELVGAYALTESGSGSDALGARTKAVLSEDGSHYILNGQKMWITNAGFADVFIVFAKVDGEHFTAFIVERNFPGVSIAPEEHKMGLNGSSTCAVNLEDARVPVENVLGEIGKGHKIAFNILNIGRLKLGVSSITGSKRLTSIAVEYAKERHQFGVPIASFGLIKHKLAEMAILSYAAECMMYRTVGMIEVALGTVDRNVPAQMLKAIEGYAVECSIMKVVGSETLDYCSDEAVQVFGGNGYSKDYPVERAYRDSRISRIYEGTNEINRLIISGQLLRRATKGELGLFQAAKKLQEEVMQGSRGEEVADTLFGQERSILVNAKKVAVAVLGSAALKYRDKVQDQQEVLAAASDIVIDIYGMESAILRTEKLVSNRGEASCSNQIDATRVFVNEAIQRIERHSRTALAVMSEGDELRVMLATLRRLLKFTPIDVISARRRIADSLIKAGKYNLS